MVLTSPVVRYGVVGCCTSLLYGTSGEQFTQRWTCDRGTHEPLGSTARSMLTNADTVVHGGLFHHLRKEF